MPRQNASQPYAPATGYTQTFPPVFFTRDPTSADTNWIQAQQWINVSTNAIWQLASFSTSGGTLSANWVQSASLVSGILPVSQGGTGVATLTGLALGSGTSAFTGVTYVPVTAWTPNMQVAGSSVGITYTEQRGFYSQVGNTVSFVISIVLSSKGAGNGAVTISNMPVTCGANGDSMNIPMQFSSITLPATNSSMVLQLNDASAVGELFFYGGAETVLTAVDDADIANTSAFYCSGIYMVA